MHTVLCFMPFRLRAQFAVEGSEINALHGSASVEDATKEIQQLFPVEKTMAVIKPNAMTEKGVSVKIKLCCRKLASSPDSLGRGLGIRLARKKGGAWGRGYVKESMLRSGVHISSTRNLI